MMAAPKHTPERVYNIDLHTHSQASPDGSLSEEDYRKMLQTGVLDYVAITDHNTADFALKLQAKLGPELGARIIVGEEIRTTKGEIIGLYLTQSIPKLLTPRQTVEAIKGQGGLVCIPHPFENVRRGMAAEDLDDIADAVDMIEVHNGRAVFQNKSGQAYAWAKAHACLGVASSDSHASAGWGKTYTVITGRPSRETLLGQLADAQYRTGFPGVRAVLYPKLNKLKSRSRRVVYAMRKPRRSKP